MAVTPRRPPSAAAAAIGGAEPTGGSLDTTPSVATCAVHCEPPRSGPAYVGSGYQYPSWSHVWYDTCMSGTYPVVMGDRGRLVIPADLRARAKLAEGTPMVIVEAPDGLLLFTRRQLRERVRADLAGLDLVEELLAERRQAAASDDAP